MSRKRYLSKTAMLAAVFFTCFFLYPETGNPVKIKSIKIMIDDEQFTWQENRDLENSGSAFFSARSLMTFTQLRPGQLISETDLGKETALFQKRMETSGYFSKAEAYVIPPQKNPEERSIMVKVTKGFLHRYGGGPIYASWALLAPTRTRDRLSLAAGMNRALVEYSTDSFLERGISFETKLLYENNSFSKEKIAEHHDFDLDLGLALQMTPDIKLGIVGRGSFSTYKNPAIALPPGFSMSPIELYFCFGPKMAAGFYPDKNLTLEVNSSLLFVSDFSDSFVFYAKTGLDAVYRLSGFFAESEVDIQWASTNLPVKLKNNLQNSFRGKKEFFDLYNDTTAIGCFQIGYDFARFRIFSLFPVSAGLFGYFDLAAASPGSLTPVWDQLHYAWGPGLRIAFDSPVFVSAAISAGWNQDGLFDWTIQVKGDN